ncbi:MAG TPA: trypsin-like serine protease [Kineosporiaceae bacterium]
MSRRSWLAVVRSRARVVGAGLGVVALGVTALVVTGSGPASAVDAVRQQLPIVAGTELSLPGGACTAGAVLTANGLLWNVTDYQRSVRYVVTAGHCGSVNDPVSVRTPSGVVQVGKVTWTSDRADLALVRIEPDASRRQLCGSGPDGPRCVISVAYTPRATGKVLLPAGAVSVTSTGTPGSSEIFCTSGITTGAMCVWHTYVPPQPISELPAGASLAESAASNTEIGDSGGPVVSRSGVLYGIIASRGRVGSSVPDVTVYTTMDQFFKEQSGYSLAPAN